MGKIGKIDLSERQLTCYESVASEVFSSPLRKEHICLVQEKNAVPSIGQGEVCLQGSLYFAGN